MPRFHFRLASVLKLRLAERRQRQSHLAEALLAEEILAQQRAELASEIRHLQEANRERIRPGNIDVDSLLNANRYDLILRARQSVLEQQSAQIAEEIKVRRHALVEADRQVRTLEKLRERQLAEHQQRELAHEVKVLDEVSQRVHATREVGP